jgi:transcriptional regulator with XRE-family HTH domain
MGEVPKQVDLGAFLRARRAERTPESVGLRSTGRRRRVEGLRREEVAQLAGISTDYYTRLEQGRIRASTAVLARLADALRLGGEQRGALFTLAVRGVELAATPDVGSEPMGVIRRMIDQLTMFPAIVVGPRTDVLCWNAAAASVFTDFAKIPESERVYIRLLFNDPLVRALHVEWEHAAKLAVGHLRRSSVAYPGDRRIVALAGELSVTDPRFREWWAADDEAVALTNGISRLRHPCAGGLTLSWAVLSCGSQPPAQLYVWSAEPGTATYEALRRLSYRVREPGPVACRGT